MLPRFNTYRRLRSYALVFFSMVLFGFSSCETMEYSPNVVFDHNTPRDINNKNIARLLANTNADDTIKIVFTGDSQRFYDDAEDLVKKVNTINGLDFLIVAGDISDFGLLKEFEWVHNILSKLYIPYITVIGNHDYAGNGDKVYRHMYGDPDFSFVYDSVKFIFHDTNGREHNFNGKIPNIDWLREQCAYDEGVSNRVAVSHVPPFDADFDKKLEQSYAATFKEAPGFVASLHGHLHGGGSWYPYNDSIPYLCSYSMEKRQFILLEIHDGKFTKTVIEY